MSSPPPHRSEELPSSSSTHTAIDDEPSDSQSVSDMSQVPQVGDDQVDTVCGEVPTPAQDAVARHAAPPRSNVHPRSHPGSGDSDTESKMTSVLATRTSFRGGSEDLMHCGRLSFSSDTLSEPGSELLLNKSFIDEPILQSERYPSLLRKLGHRQTFSRFAPYFAEPLGNVDPDRRPSRTDSLPSLTNTDPGNSPLSSRAPTLHEPRELATPPEILPVSEGISEQSPDQRQHQRVVTECDGYKLYGEDSMRDYLRRLHHPFFQGCAEPSPTNVPRLFQNHEDEWRPCDVHEQKPNANAEVYEVSDESEWDLSDTNEEMDESNPYYDQKSDIIQHVLSKYGEWKQTPASGGGNASQSANTGMITPLSATGFSGRQASKRPLPDRNDGQDNDDDDDDERARKRPSFGSSAMNSRIKLLACPFAKKDPLRYRDCYKIKIRRIQDVKQHLRRQHTPIYCPRCLKVFPAEAQLNDHQRSVTACEVREEPKPEGIISPEQKDRLKPRISPKLPIRDQWFSIFQILFPDDRCPSSPFVDGELGEDVSCFANFCETRGTDVIVSRLKELGLKTEDALEEDHITTILNSTVAEGMREIVDKYKEQTISAGVPSLTEDDTPAAPSLTEGEASGAPPLASGDEVSDSSPLMTRQASIAGRGHDSAFALLSGVSQALADDSHCAEPHAVNKESSAADWIDLHNNENPGVIDASGSVVPAMQSSMEIFGDGIEGCWDPNDSNFNSLYG